VAIAMNKLPLFIAIATYKNELAPHRERGYTISLTFVFYLPGLEGSPKCYACPLRWLQIAVGISAGYEHRTLCLYL
jgi:hypothetical protein